MTLIPPYNKLHILTLIIEIEKKINEKKISMKIQNGVNAEVRKKINIEIRSNMK